jgi:hypothetical protein
MELNNKFGNCCNCPALMSDGRLFTSYVPHKEYNSRLMKELGVSNSIEYKTVLQNNGETINKDIIDKLTAGTICKNNGTNKFYQQVNINEYFDNNFLEKLNSPSELFSNK